LTNDNPEQHFDSLERLMGNLGTIQPPPAPAFELEAVALSAPISGIEISASVNFVAKAWMLGVQDAAGLGHLALLCQNLSRGYLWDKVRVEGGAYGSFASYGATSPAFSCASYRDPNLMRTLEVYEQGLRSCVEQLDQATVDQAIIGTIGGIDKPRSPHGKGFSETGALLLGKTPQFRQTAREAVLDATAADIRAKAQEILDSGRTAVTVVGSAGAMDEAAEGGVTLSREKLLG
jgi:Zn-dependent M16 (insulinase) family peptidase